MTTTRQRFTPRPRTTVPLKGTTRKTPLDLDHSADLALAYAQSWLQRAGSLKVPASGVVRRALRLYVAHLQSNREGPDEVRAIERACKASEPDEAQRAAWERLEALVPGQPLPPYVEILHGPQWAAEADALTDRAEALAAHILASRPARTRPTRPAKQ